MSGQFYHYDDILRLPKLPGGVRTSQTRRYELQDDKEIPQAWQGNICMVPVWYDDGSGEQLYQVRGYKL